MTQTTLLLYVAFPALVAALVLAFLRQFKAKAQAAARLELSAEVKEARSHVRLVCSDMERLDRLTREAIKNAMTLHPLPVRQMAEPKSKPAGKKPARTKR